MPQFTPNPRLQNVVTLSSASLVACPGCTKPFAPRRPNQRYCATKCRLMAFQLRREQARTERDAHVRIKLREAQHAVAEALWLLRDPPPAPPYEENADARP
jgi:hypothetical protein